MGYFRNLTNCAQTAQRLGGSALLTTLAGLLVVGLVSQPADARGRAARVESDASAPATSRTQYAIEFRSRYAQSYGHTFIMYGRLNKKGELVDRVVAGLHPAGETPKLWMIGHVVPVVSETGPSDGDLEDEYVSARYRVVVEEAEFRQIVQYIKYKQAHSGTWHAIFNNCSGWVADVGRYMGLTAPNHLVMPANFINGMRQMNEGNDRRNAPSRAALAAAQ